MRRKEEEKRTKIVENVNDDGNNDQPPVDGTSTAEKATEVTRQQKDESMIKLTNKCNEAEDNNKAYRIIGNMAKNAVGRIY